MRIATNLFYDRSNTQMGALSDRADALQTQIATGRKLTAPSSDAAAYRQLTGIHRTDANATTDAKSIGLAQSLLTASDTALEGIETQLQRARELAVQANTGTLSTQQKATLASTLDAIVQDMLQLANAKDSSGQPLFGGATGDTAYVQASDGTISYAGAGERGAIPIGDGASIVATTGGDRIFGNLPASGGGTGDVFRFVQNLATTLRSGGDASASLDDLSTALSSVTDARASVGARGARLDLEADRMNAAGVAREETRSAIEDTDVTQAITELQKTLTVLQATQASFGKLSSLSLFNYLT